MKNSNGMRSKGLPSAADLAASSTRSHRLPSSTELVICVICPKPVWSRAFPGMPAGRAAFIVIRQYGFSFGRSRGTLTSAGMLRHDIVRNRADVRPTIGPFTSASLYSSIFHLFCQLSSRNAIHTLEPENGEAREPEDGASPERERADRPLLPGCPRAAHANRRSAIPPPGVFIGGRGRPDGEGAQEEHREEGSGAAAYIHNEGE